MKRSLNLVQGVDKVLSVVARNPDTGARLDLTGLTGTAITWKLARDPLRDADQSSVLTYTLSDNISLTDADQGEFRITIEGEDLAALVGYFNHACIVTLSNALYRPLFGQATIEKDIQ